MKLKTTAALLATAALGCLATPAFAQDAMVAAPEDQSAEIEFLKAQLESMQAQIADLQKAKKSSAPTFKGSPLFGDKEAGWDFKVRGRLQYDFAYVSNPSNGVATNELGFSNELRRGRIGVEGTTPGSFAYKFEADFAGNKCELADAYFQWKGKVAAISFGQHNNFQSLEELTSSRFISFMERAAFTDAFAFERRIGVSATLTQGDFKLDAGVFTDDISSVGGGNNSYSLDARAVFAPEIAGGQLHFGASAHHRELNDISGGIRYRQRPQVHSTGIRFVATPTLPTSTETSYGVEAAGIFGPFHLAGEAHWMEQGIDLPGATDPSYFGGYAEVGYFFTGESRGYKGGTFDRTKVKNPVNKGGMGAFQGIARVDYLDLNDSDAGVLGGKQTAYQLGLTWIPVDYVRFLLNYSRLELKDAAIAINGDRDYGVDVVGMRAQIDF